MKFTVLCHRLDEENMGVLKSRRKEKRNFASHSSSLLGLLYGNANFAINCCHLRKVLPLILIPNQLSEAKGKRVRVRNRRS